MQWSAKSYCDLSRELHNDHEYSPPPKNEDIGNEEQYQFYQRAAQLEDGRRRHAGRTTPTPAQTPDQDPAAEFKKFPGE